MSMFSCCCIGRSAEETTENYRLGFSMSTVHSFRLEKPRGAETTDAQQKSGKDVAVVYLGYQPQNIRPDHDAQSTAKMSFVICQGCGKCRWNLFSMPGGLEVSRTTNVSMYGVHELN